MNVSTSLEIVSAPLGEPLISDHITNYIMVMLSLMILTFSSLSVVLNILNVYIFINTKLDSVTVCFISLALSDLTSALLLSTDSLLSIIVAFGVPWSRNFPIYTYMLTLGHSFSVDLSSATTTYIAVQRGLCVTFPFITRHVFNKNRSLIICVAIFLVILAFSLPRFSSYKLKTLVDPVDNSSTLVKIEYFKWRASYEPFYFVFMKTALALIEYGIMVICTVAISIGMRSSMKLKQKSNFHSSQTQSGENLKVGKAELDTNGTREFNSEDKDQFQTRNDSKQKLVVKQSLIVVLMHVILTTPRMSACLYYLLEPRFQLGGQFNNLFFIVFNAINVTDSINCFVNFFVYSKFNTKFQDFFQTKIYTRDIKP